MTVDASNNVVFIDNNVIRKCSPTGTLTTIAGTGDLGIQDGPVAGAQFYYPGGIMYNTDGSLWILDNAYGDNQRLRKIVDGVVTTPYSFGTITYNEIASSMCHDDLGNIILCGNQGSIVFINKNRINSTIYRIGIGRNN